MKKRKNILNQNLLKNGSHRCLVCEKIDILIENGKIEKIKN